MKKFLRYCLKHWLSVVFSIFIGFLSAFFLTNLYNTNNSYYEANVVVENIEEFDTTLLNNQEELEKIKANGYSSTTNSNKYENIDIAKMLSNNDFTYEVVNNEIIIQTKYKYYDIFFLSSTKSVSNRAKTFIRDLVKDIAGDQCKYEFQNSNNIVTLNKYYNKWDAGVIGLFIGFVLAFGCLMIVYVSKTNNHTINNEVIDNQIISSLNKNFWKDSVKPLKKVKDMTTIAMLFALMLACKFIPIPSGFGNLGLSFTYLFFSIICMIYGPVYGFVVGIFSDVIGYFLPNSGTGAFNLGYTLQAALTGFIYGICFFKTKVTFKKVLTARVLVNFFMNALYGSILNIFVLYYTPGMSGSEFWSLVKSYALLFSLPKNIIYLLPQSLLLWVVLKAVIPVLKRFKLLDKQEASKVEKEQ